VQCLIQSEVTSLKVAEDRDLRLGIIMI